MIFHIFVSESRFEIDYNEEDTSLWLQCDNLQNTITKREYNFES